MFGNGQEREKSGSLTPSYLIMAIALPILTALLPISLSGSAQSVPMAWISCLFSVAILLLFIKSFIAIAACALAVTFSLSYIGDPAPIAILLGTVLASGIYSAAIAAAKRGHIPFLTGAPMLSAALAFAMTNDIFLTLLSLICFPPALAMGLGSRRGLDRTRAITLFVAVAVIELAGSVTAYIAWQNGGISIEIVEHAISYLQGGIEWALRAAISGAGAAASDEAVLSEIRFMSAYAINLLPGITAAALLTVGFLAHRAECSLFARYERESLLGSSETPVVISCTAAIVFLIAHVFSYTSGASHAPSFLGVAAENLALVLLPALLLIGWEKLAELPKKIGILAIAVWIGTVLLANMLSASIISVLALIGAFCIILSRTDSWAKEHYRKGEDQ